MLQTIEAFLFSNGSWSLVLKRCTEPDIRLFEVLHSLQGAAICRGDVGKPRPNVDVHRTDDHDQELQQSDNDEKHSDYDEMSDERSNHDHDDDNDSPLGITEHRSQAYWHLS